MDDSRANNLAGWHVVADEIDDEGFAIALANASRSTGIRISSGSTMSSDWSSRP